MNADRFNEALLSYLQGLSAKEQINLYENQNISGQVGHHKSKSISFKLS